MIFPSIADERTGLVVVCLTCRHFYEYESSASRLSDVLAGIYHLQLTDLEATECLKECTALSLLYDSSDYNERFA